MAYLRDYEHDIFVSYAHSEALNDWSKGLVDDARKLVAAGLGMRQAKDVDLWMDYKICGNEPLTRQLRDKVEKSGVLLVLMSEWYLEFELVQRRSRVVLRCRPAEAGRPTGVRGPGAFDRPQPLAGRVQGRARPSPGRVRLRA